MPMQGLLAEPHNSTSMRYTAEQQFSLLTQSKYLLATFCVTSKTA